MKAVEPLLKVLRDEGVLDSIPEEGIFNSSKEGPIRTLDRLNIVSEDVAMQALSNSLKIPVLDLDDPDVRLKTNFPEFVGQVDFDACVAKRVIPISIANDIVVAAFANPLDMDASQLLEFSLSKQIRPVIAKESQIIAILNELFHVSTIEYDTIVEAEEGDYIELIGDEKEANIDMQDVEAPPIIKLGNKIFSDAVAQNASDIHIEPKEGCVDVRFRIDGVMHNIFEIPKRLQPYLVTRIKILAGMDIAERRKPQDGRIRARLKDEVVDLRVSSVPTSYGEKVVLRLLRKSAQTLEFSTLGFSPELEKIMRSSLQSRGKMMLVTGPTGSGKTTTLYTAVTMLADGSNNIETVEDPVEYQIPGVHQIQVNESAGVTFASALRSILRQDPDVIMIGEIRDSETAQIALQSAQTGHLVLSTLHTNSAPAAVTRLINIGADPFIVASCLSVVVAQRLVRKLCEDCAIPASSEYIEKYQDVSETFSLNEDASCLKEAVGCVKCNGTGYKGRIGIYSVLRINEEISDLILKRASLTEITRAARESGFLTLAEAAKEKLMLGVTSLQEIRPFVISGEEGVRRSSEGVDSEDEVVSVSAIPVNEPVKEEEIEKDEFGISRQKVVLVEDDEDVRRILSMLLEKEMFEVIEAENGAEGLEAVYQHEPTVVLCDLMMPIMDGRQFLLKMKNHDDTKNIPIVILTAADTESNETNLIDLGASDFVSKSSSSSVMLSRIRNAITKSGS